jgi:rare lipoprotein A
MSALPRDRAVLVAVLCTVASLCAAATAQAAAGTGGAIIPDVLPVSTGGVGYGDPDSYSLVVRPIAVLHRPLVAKGTMPGAAGRKVVLQRLDAARGWRNLARARIHSTGRFKVTWRADRMGRLSLRAVVSGRRHASASSSAAPIAKVTVYRPALATFYGPGFFGEQTACGQVLGPDTHGVAHRKLPCGTLVAVTYAGREIVVPVIDRGPFHAGYSWDLTQATADALGFTAAGAGEIGYARVADAPAQ